VSTVGIEPGRCRDAAEPAADVGRIKWRAGGAGEDEVVVVPAFSCGAPGCGLAVPVIEQCFDTSCREGDGSSGLAGLGVAACADGVGFQNVAMAPDQRFHAATS